MINIFDDLIKDLGLGPKDKNIDFYILGKHLELDRLNKAVLITGSTESGKTLIALDTMNNNMDKSILYIDTMQSVNRMLPDNTILMSTNDLDYIENYLREVDKEDLDCLIIDGLSNLTSDDDDWNCEKLRYETVQKYITSLLTLCASKNIFLIAINTFNMRGTSSNLSNKLTQQFQVIASLNRVIEVGSNGMRITANITKDLLENKLGNHYIMINVPRGRIGETNE